MEKHAMLRTSVVALWLGAIAAAMAMTVAARGEPDKSRYIGIDEIKPGMAASCLTVFEGTKIESFPLEVVSVVRNISPGRNAILVRGTDERFKHTGPVAGCSGSPVYIDGRMAGALAFGWSFSKEPLYGVTPIEEMLSVGKGKYDDAGTRTAKLDLAEPLDLDAVWRSTIVAMSASQESATGMTQLPVPLAVSLPQYATDRLSKTLGPLGFVPVAGGGMAGSPQDANAELIPGAALAIPLVTGDITLSAVGTVTEVVDGKFYAFGHSLLGYGKMELPVGPAYIHTVVANLNRSFKLGNAMEVTGTLTRDEDTAVYGVLGKTPSMIDMRVTVERYNDPQTRTYNCKVARNDVITPQLVNAVISGAVYFKGELPPEHTVKYEVRIKAKASPEIVFENVSTDADLMDVAREVVAPTAILINNRFRKVEIESIDVKVNISQKSSASTIKAFDVSRTRLKAGQSLEAAAMVHSFRAGSSKHTWLVNVPDDLPAGVYRLTVMGPDAYLKFLVQAAPYRFTSSSLDGIMATVNNVLTIRRDRLYSVLLLPSGGLTIERTALPDLPPGKAVVLADPSRTFKVQPFQHWIEQQIPVDGIVTDVRAIDIAVEEK
jgi:hypothetical protein